MKCRALAPASGAGGRAAHAAYNHGCTGGRCTRRVKGCCPAQVTLCVTAIFVGLPLACWEMSRHGYERHFVAWFVAGVFVLLAIPISVYGVAVHIEHYSCPKLQKHVVRRFLQAGRQNGALPPASLQPPLVLHNRVAYAAVTAAARPCLALLCTCPPRPARAAPRPRCAAKQVRILWMPCVYGLTSWLGLRFKARNVAAAAPAHPVARTTRPAARPSRRATRCRAATARAGRGYLL